MNKVLVSVVLLTATIVSGAAENKVAAKRGISDPAIREKFLNASGGWLYDTREAKGKFVVVNVGGKLSSEEAASLGKTVQDDIHYFVEVKSVESVQPKTARAEAEKFGGVFTAFIVENADLPTLMTLPEDACSLVNLSALSSDGPDRKKLLKRVRVELVRSFGLLMSCGYSLNDLGAMRIAKSIEDLDAILNPYFDDQAQANMRMITAKFGLVPFKRSFYKKALQEGWAPKPENAYQQKIWDDFHAEPSKPLKITAGKDGKPVVK